MGIADPTQRRRDVSNSFVRPRAYPEQAFAHHWRYLRGNLRAGDWEYVRLEIIPTLHAAAQLVGFYCGLNEDKWDSYVRVVFIRDPRRWLPLAWTRCGAWLREWHGTARLKRVLAPRLEQDARRLLARAT